MERTKLALLGAFFLTQGIVLSQRAVAADLNWQNPDLVLEYQSCVYGRGSNAKTEAKSFAPDLVIPSYYEAIGKLSSSQQRRYKNGLWPEKVLSNNELNQLTIALGDPYLQGSDTCVDVTARMKSETDSDDDWEWDESSESMIFRIEVIAKSTSQKSALHSAEDLAKKRALQRALSGLGYNPAIAHNMPVNREIIHDSVLLEQSDQNGGVRVLMDITVDMAALDGLVGDKYDLLNKPVLFVQAKPESLRNSTTAMLQSLGYQSGVILDDADIIVKLNAKSAERDGKSQLSMSLEWFDKRWQRLAYWENTPQQFLLPTSDDVETRLLSLHLESNRTHLKNAMNNALDYLLERGGRVITITFPNSLSQVDIANWLRQNSSFVETKIDKHSDRVTVELRSVEATKDIVEKLKSSSIFTQHNISNVEQTHNTIVVR